MTLEQLRIFIAVADRQHVTQAARALHLTQSAASAAIAALEARYQVKLFDRIGRGIVLTQAGRLFLAEARAVLARAHDAAQALDDLAGLKRGSLTLAASQTVGNYWLPPRLAAFRAAHPQIDLQLSITNTETAAARVRERSVDLALVEDDVDDPQISARRIRGDTVLAVVSRSHPLARQRSVTPAMLTGAEWVLREPGSGTRAIFERALRRHGVRLADLRIVLELPSNEAVRNAVETGPYATALSDLVVAPALAAKTLVDLKLDLPQRSFLVLRHKERHPGAAETALLQAIGTG